MLSIDESRLPGRTAPPPPPPPVVLGNPPDKLSREVSADVPLLKLVSKQLRSTAHQIEQAVVGVCSTFQQISEQARKSVVRSAGFLSSHKDRNKKASVEDLIGRSRDTFESLLQTLTKSTQISSRAIEGVEQINRNALAICQALTKLEQITTGNRILALNARIEAARAGHLGRGFEVVATEVVRQAEQSQKIIIEVGAKIDALRSVASSALADLSGMNKENLASAQAERKQVEQTLQAFSHLDQEMRSELAEAVRDNEQLSAEINKAVSGMQFQDRVNQRIDHAAQALDDCSARLTEICGHNATHDAAYIDAIVKKYTMREERFLAGQDKHENDGADIELF